MRLKFTYSLFFLLTSFSLFGQKGAIQLQLELVDDVVLSKKYKIPTKYDSQEELMLSLESLVGQLRKNGFVTASVDSIACLNDSCRVQLYLGESFQLSKLNNGNLSEEAWNSLKKGSKEGVIQLLVLEKELLEYYENNGFPYAQVWLDSIELQETSFSASLYADPKENIKIDSVVIHGNTKTKSKFLQRYLGIQSGDDYNQKKLNSLSNKLNQLSYLRESKEAELYFTPGKATLHVYLEKQKSNQFNLILGVLPNDQLVDKKVTITGEGKLQLLNSFGVGEEIFAEFRQIKPRTQNLDISFAYPYIVNAPVGTFGSFNLYKNDSLFIDINTQIGLLYQFGGFNRLKFYYDNQTSNILNADTVAVKASGILPNTLDIRNNRYGASLELQQLDYVLNPKKGYSFVLGAAVGVNKIKVNQSLASLVAFDGSLLQNRYDSLQLKKINYSLEFKLNTYIPIGKRSTFLLANQTKAYIAKNILNNEKFRIGGYRLLRGFDEEAIYTPFYSIFTTEYRVLLSKNSYFNLFADVGIVDNELKQDGSIDIPVGFGAGVALETKGGIFSLSYALGRNLDNKIQIRNGKIHFGFISLF